MTRPLGQKSGAWARFPLQPPPSSHHTGTCRGGARTGVSPQGRGCQEGPGPFHRPFFGGVEVGVQRWSLEGVGVTWPPADPEPVPGLDSQWALLVCAWGVLPHTPSPPSPVYPIKCSLDEPPGSLSCEDEGSCGAVGGHVDQLGGEASASLSSWDPAGWPLIFPQRPAGATRPPPPGVTGRADPQASPGSTPGPIQRAWLSPGCGVVSTQEATSGWSGGGCWPGPHQLLPHCTSWGCGHGCVLGRPAVRRGHPPPRSCPALGPVR